MLDNKPYPPKKFPGKRGSETVFSTSAKKRKKAVTEVSAELFYSDEDPEGMYTGVPADRTQIPMQDADDL